MAWADAFARLRGVITLSGKVGHGGVNRPVDVMLVQHLLNLNASAAGLSMSLGITGIIDRVASAAITKFQRDMLQTRAPDGCIDPGGRTFMALAQPASASDTVTVLRGATAASWSRAGARPGELSSQLGAIDATRFIPLYDRQFRHLGGSAREGMGWLIDFVNRDADIADVGHCAYMLATVKLECAERWRPVEEFGHGASRPYGTAVTVRDSAGTSYSNVYYGRGYVQITWKDNYERIGRAIGLGDRLMIDPALALDPAVSYAVMSNGMRRGLFTGKRLSDYINRDRCDYPSARRIINGLSGHTMIAGYATAIELLLRATSG